MARRLFKQQKQMLSRHHALNIVFLDGLGLLKSTGGTAEGFEAWHEELSWDGKQISRKSAERKWIKTVLSLSMAILISAVTGLLY